MKGFFYPDPDHDSPDIIKQFCKVLPTLKASGVSVVFLEFLYETVPSGDTMLEHFAYCSGGRRGMAKDYLGIVHLARELGMEVVGLSRAEDYGISRGPQPRYFAYRLLGPYDGAVAWRITKHAANKMFVVFLGAGHWPMLKHFLPGLTAVVECNEVLASLVDFKTSIPYLPEMSALADEFTYTGYTARVVACGVQHSRIIDGILREFGQKHSLDNLMQMFQDKVGLPPTLLQLNYMIAKRKLLQLEAPRIGVLRLKTV